MRGHTSMMQRTQVYFDPEILELLKEEAISKKITLARVIREKVAKNIRRRKSVKQKSAAEVLLGLARLGEKLNVRGPKNLAKNIDKYVYR